MAVEADSLYAKLIEQGQAALKTAQEQLSGNDPFAGVLGIVSANRIYGIMPDLRKDLGAATRDLSKSAELKALLSPAEALDRALALASQKNPMAQKTAAAQLSQVAARFPNTPAGELATARLAELGIAAPAESGGAAALPAGQRTWSDATGKFKIEAEAVGVAGGNVQLKKSDGSIVAVPLDKLSQADRDLLAGAK